jgi:hypothetical protein
VLIEKNNNNKKPKETQQNRSSPWPPTNFIFTNYWRK